MNTQVWDIDAVIFGNFSIISEVDLIISISPQYPIIRKFLLNPEFNDRNEQTGKFNILISFEIDTKENDRDNNFLTKVADTGRDIFNNYMDILVYLSICPIRIFRKPVLKYNYPGTNRHRIIEFTSQEATVKPPKPLTDISIFEKKLEQKHRLILKWLRRAIEEKDIINSIISSFIPLEILANEFPSNKKHIIKCDKCRNIIESRPGMRIQIENFLINELEYKKEQFIKIWKLRNDIFHGRLAITSEKIRDLTTIKQDLILAIIKGLNKVLDIDSSDLPGKIITSPFIDSFLVTEYTV